MEKKEKKKLSSDKVMENNLKNDSVNNNTESEVSAKAQQTIDIPTDKSVQWNNIKATKNLQFKTIDDPILIDQLIADRNAHHLNQADGTPFTIEPLLSLIDKDTFTILSQELLDEKANLSQLD